MKQTIWKLTIRRPHKYKKALPTQILKDIAEIVVPKKDLSRKVAKKTYDLTDEYITTDKEISQGALETEDCVQR